MDPAILQHLAKKEWKPDWLEATPFGSTMYYADYLLSLAENGRDLFSITHPFLSTELDPHWRPPNAWWTKNYVGGLSLTRSDRIALFASEITPVEFTRGRGRILCSFTIPHCNARVDGDGIEDTPTEKVRDVGAGDIRVRAARSAYFMTTRYPEMIRAFPIFGRGAYITALYAAFKQSGFNLSSAPRLENDCIILSIDTKKCVYPSMSRATSTTLFCEEDSDGLCCILFHTGRFGDRRASRWSHRNWFDEFAWCSVAERRCRVGWKRQQFRRRLGRWWRRRKRDHRTQVWRRNL